MPDPLMMLVPGIDARNQHVDAEKEGHQSHTLGFPEFVDQRIGDDDGVFRIGPENGPSAFIHSKAIPPRITGLTAQLSLQRPGEKSL